MTDAEVAAGVEAAHTIGRRVAAHARASVAVKRAVRHGVDIIYHCDFADEEALDLLEGAKDRIFTGPAFSLIVNRLEALRGDNTPAGRVIADRLKAIYEASCTSMSRCASAASASWSAATTASPTTRRAATRATSSCSCTHFGFSPSEALQAATRTGGEAMRAARRDRAGRSRAISPTCCWSTAIP